MNALLLASTFILKPLFPELTPMKEKQELLAPYFDPIPGKEMLKVEDFDRIKGRDDPINIVGYVWVTPPKGHCLIIQDKSHDFDRNVCERTRIQYKLADLNQAGQITWVVIQSEDDEGTPLIWDSPYRIANYIPLGGFKNNRNIKSPIYSCEATYDGIHRKIVLTHFDDTKWYIPLPDKDKKIAGRKKKKDLYVKVMTTDKKGKAKAADVSTQKPSKAEVTRKHKLMSSKLSGDYKKKKKKEYTFLVSPWNAFEMNSSRLMAVGGPLGLNGKCRYKFKGVWLDRNSGVIECFNTDKYDAIYTHLTCSSKLPIIKAEKPKEEKNEAK